MGQTLERVTGIAKSQLRTVMADRLFEWTIGNRLFDLGELNSYARAVAWFGYGSIVTLLISILGLEEMGAGSQASALAGAQSVYRVPVEVMVIAFIGFIAAWALILTGVLYARRAVAILFLVVFGIEIIVIGARSIFVSLFLFALAVAILVLFRTRPRWRDASRTPLTSMLLWATLLSAFVVLVWSGTPRLESLSASLTSVMSFTNVFAIALWVAMAFGAVVTSVRLSISLVRLLRERLRPAGLQSAAMLLALFLGPGSMTFGIIERDPAWIIGGSAGVLMVPAVAILIARRRWTDRQARVVMGLAIALLLFTLGLSLAMSDSRVGRSVQASGMFPPVLLFLMLAADNLLRFGKPIKALVPRLGSQIAWVLIYLGMVVLVLTSLLFMMNHTSVVTGQLSRQWPRVLASLTMATMLVSGPIYLAWVVWRRSEWWSGPIES